MAYRDPQLMHIDQDLTNISAGFEPQSDAFIGPRMFPAVRVSKQSDKYRVFNREVWGRVTDDYRAPGAFANELPPMTFSRDSYYTQEHALADPVPRESQANADAGLNDLADSTERLTNTILVNRENEMLTLALDTSQYASGFTTTLSGTSQWNDYTNSDPIGVAKTALDAIHDVLFRDPNTAIIGRAVYRKLSDHTKVLARIMVGTAIGTRQLIEQVFEWPTITIAGAGKVTSAYGAAETVGYWWGKHVWLGYVPENPGLKTPAFGYEFVRPVASANGEIMPTERWYEIGRRADVVRVSREYDIKLITVDGSGKSAGAAYLIANAVA